VEAGAVDLLQQASDEPHKVTGQETVGLGGDLVIGGVQ
jgi:hypothetical protein